MLIVLRSCFAGTGVVGASLAESELLGVGRCDVEVVVFNCGLTGNLEEDEDAFEGLRAILEELGVVGRKDALELSESFFGGDAVVLFRVLVTGSAGSGPLGGGWIDGRVGRGSVVAMASRFDIRKRSKVYVGYGCRVQLTMRKSRPVRRVRGLWPDRELATGEVPLGYRIGVAVRRVSRCTAGSVTSHGGGCERHSRGQ